MEAVSLVTHTDVVDGSAVVAVAGDVDLVSAAHLREVMGDALGRSCHLIVDVADMTFIDSSGLRVLVALSNDARGRSHRLALRNVPRHAERVLDLTGLAEWFDREPDA